MLQHIFFSATFVHRFSNKVKQYDKDRIQHLGT